jgi:hypothetical protein
MNIPLCHMISMPVVRPTFKIDVFKMEHAFQMGYQKSNKISMILPQTTKGRRHLLQITFMSGTIIGRL